MVLIGSLTLELLIPVPQGSEFRLGIKFNDSAARLYSLPKVHLLEPEAPAMYFRYIES